MKKIAIVTKTLFSFEEFCRKRGAGEFSRQRGIFASEKEILYFVKSWISAAGREFTEAILLPDGDRELFERIQPMVRGVVQSPQGN